MEPADLGHLASMNTRRTNLLTAAVTTFIVCSGCDPKSVGKLGETESDSGASDSGTSDSGTSETDADTDAGSSDTGPDECTPGVSTCEPARDREPAGGISIIPQGPEETITTECAVIAISGAFPLNIELECALQDYAVGLPVGVDGAGALSVGDNVAFEVIFAGGFAITPWFRILNEQGELVVGGGEGFEPLPPGQPAFFAPLEIEVAESVCAQECYVQDACYYPQRKGLSVTVDGSAASVIVDGNQGTVGDYEVVVERAMARDFSVPGVQCFDIPDRTFVTVVAALPSA